MTELDEEERVRLMINSSTRDRWEIIQILSLVVWGLGAFLYSPPNKVEMTKSEIAGLGLVAIGSLLFLAATVIRIAKWLRAKL